MGEMILTKWFLTTLPMSLKKSTELISVKIPRLFNAYAMRRKKQRLSFPALLKRKLTFPSLLKGKKDRCIS